MLNSLYSTILQLDLKCLCDNYKLWGPSAQICLSLMDHKQLNHRRNQSDDPNGGLELVDQLFAASLQPTSESRQDVTVKIVTGHLHGFVSSIQKRFYKAIGGHTWFGTLPVEFNPNKRAHGRLDNDMVCRYWQYVPVINIYS
jgi:hypothetical protein